MTTLEYNEDLLQTDRPQSMYDKEVHKYFNELFKENFANNENLSSDFVEVFHNWIISSKLNSLNGLELFKDRDVCIGVTQYIDDLYQVHHKNIKYLEHEYKYHHRLNPEGSFSKVGNLKKGDQLILSLPFPFYGDIHPQMNNIIQHCNEHHIDLHIDACWYGCSRDIQFNLEEPCIKSIGFSLSKGLGLGANRIGLRYSKKRWNGPISIMNDFNMNLQAQMWLGIEFMNKFGSDFWQNKYYKHYLKICHDFNLKPTKAIHIALKKYDWGYNPVGVRPLLRHLAKQ